VIVRSLALAVLVAAVALRAGPVAAEPDADGRAKAAARFKQGRAFFQLGDYDRALAEYQAALDLTAEPLLVFNIALCHDRANRPEQALQAFRRFLELAPDGAVADEAREDVARLVPIVDKLAADRAAEEAGRRAEAAKRDAPRPRPPSRVPRALMVAGAAIAVVGATSHVLAWRTRGRLEAARDPESYFADRDTFELQRNVAVGAYAAGTITIATGMVLELVVRRRTGVELAVSTLPGGAALAVGWSR
jgi:tetratricopeptide (TPR) repeat protein